MSFCATCGRQRNGTARFCAGCGAEFTEPPPAAENGSARRGARRRAISARTRADDGPPGPPAGVTRTRRPTRSRPGTSQSPQAVRQRRRLDLAAHRDRERHARAGGRVPDVRLYPGQPVQLGQPGHAARPALPARAAARRGPPPGPPARGGRRGLFIALAVIVVLAAGGGAYALATTLGKHSTAPSGASTPPASSPATGSATGGATQQASSPATSARARRRRRR